MFLSGLLHVRNYSNWLKILLFLVVPSNLSWAQLEVKGKYLDDNGKGIPYANVLLLNSEDSTLVKGHVTDQSGSFLLITDSDGSFRVAIKYIGYEEFYSDILLLNKANNRVDMGVVTAIESSTELNEVVIETYKPLFEQKIDRTIVNVESNISASGGSALDVLARSPGVTVDRMNNRIALAGKQGVRIMIDGKISQIPLEAAVQMLDGMNAESIEKIELITTPPAKYEAEGDAGMINVVLKKESDEGTNGNLSLFGGYGRKEKYGGSINFNNRGKKINLYGDYSFRNDVTEQLFASDRVVQVNGQAVNIDTENNRDAFTRVHDGRVGVDWNISKKTIIGGLFSIFDRRWEMDAFAEIDETTNGSPSEFIEMSTFEINAWTLLVGNVNLRHVFDDRHSFSIDMDYIDYGSDNPTDYHQNFYDNHDNLTNDGILRSRKETPIKTWVSKVDYTVIVSDKITLEAGGKASFSRLQNDITVENFENGAFVLDQSLTSDADMLENIGAGYASVTINATSKIDLLLGIRYEHTRTNIDTQKEANVIDRNFGNWFPSIFFQNKINDNNSWVLSYSRRITRPSFFQIAPFVIFVDPDSFWSGNISLLPAMIDAVKAEYKHKSILLSLQYSHDKNSISLFQPRINADNKQVSTAENLEYMDTYSINMSFPVQVTDWWESQFNLSGNLIEVKADFLDNPVNLSVKNFTLNGFQKFSLPANFTAEVSGFYQSKQLFGIAEMKGFGSLDLGLEKKFENSQLRIAYTDIFKTNRWRFATKIPGENLDTETLIDFETSVVRVTYSTTFGNRKLKVNRRETTGSEEEQRRFE